jgi:hypothetical protein
VAGDSGHPEVMEPLLDAAECAPPDWADEPFEQTAGVAASFLINVPALTTLNRSYLAQLDTPPVPARTADHGGLLLQEVGQAVGGRCSGHAQRMTPGSDKTPGTRASLVAANPDNVVWHGGHDDGGELRAVRSALLSRPGSP